jgi:uncharacterized membrane protein
MSPKPKPARHPKPKKPPEAVWTYRGYELKSSEFTTAMVHFFRAEVQRANAWRLRLDTTTNWAVVTTGAVLSFAFTQAEFGHFVILLDLMLVTMFLAIEARRYRYYELWSTRVRLMETDFFAAMLVPPFHPSPDWAETLAENLLMPRFPISNSEAVGRRLRRNYLWIYAVIAISWMAHLWLFPTPSSTWSEVIARAGLGMIRGEWFVYGGSAFFLAVLIVAFATVGLQHSAGEILPRFEGVSADFLASIANRELNPIAWFRPSSRRKQLLTLIITEKAKVVSDVILQDMHRGVTVLTGKGGFTGKERQILVVAITITEVSQLKSLVSQADSDAFVIVSPAQSVFGRGFESLKETPK